MGGICASLKHFAGYSETGLCSLDALEVPIVVVTCTRCATQFQFDESRLPIKGAKVRCSRCREAFFLAHPKSAELAPEARLVEEDLSASPNAVSPIAEPLEETSPTRSETQEGESLQGADFDWDFDFNAHADEQESSDVPSTQSESPAEERPVAAPRAAAKKGEQTVFASVEDLADWLADRTDTLEPELIGEQTESGVEASSPKTAPVQGTPVALGMIKKGKDSEKSFDRSCEESRQPPMSEVVPGSAIPVEDPGEGLLADLLGISRGQVPRWFRAGVHGAVQVIGWGLTLVLVTAGLVSGLWPDF
ncbi:MAG: zinc-ribbon domain-containing protein [Myxococcota bacterium]|nr:zinc-ribbon domain-containing protein [Myxococcota bacterium]